MSRRRQENQRRTRLHLGVCRLVVRGHALIIPQMRAGNHERRAILARGLRARDQDPNLADVLPAEGRVVAGAPHVLVAVERLLLRAGPHVEAHAQGEPRRDVRVLRLHVVRAGVVRARDVHVQELVAEARQEGMKTHAMADGRAAGGERPQELGFLWEEGPGGLVGEVVVRAGEVGLDCGEHVLDVGSVEHVFDDEAAVAEEERDCGFLTLVWFPFRTPFGNFCVPTSSSEAVPGNRASSGTDSVAEPMMN